jgi:isoquinoline 1-oxidoreductase subunit beta
MSDIRRLSRRELLKLGMAGSGLVLGVYDPAFARQKKKAPVAPPAPKAVFSPNAFLKIDSAGAITIFVTRTEVGQGVRTALPQIIADEMEADWASVRIAQAPFDPAKYGNQNTGGSDSIRSLLKPLREAGATAREMLISAAAKQWNVATDECRALNGSVVHTSSGRKLTYGQLAAGAAKQPMPKEVKLKESSALRYIGKPVHRIDTPSKVDGSAKFSLDVRVPGMLYATVARSPVFGGKLKKVDSAKALKVPGVKRVVQISSGVAVVAANTWAAIQGRETLTIEWDEGPSAKESSTDLRTRFEEASKQPGKVIKQTGNAAGIAGNVIEAVYESPFQAHAPMEPINCTAAVTKTGCEIWAPAQIPGWAHGEVQRVTGLQPQAIKLNITLHGGAFGRGINPDFVVEAVEISKVMGAPVKALHTREDDIRHDFYRPASYHRLTGAVDPEGWPWLWTHRIVSPSISSWMDPNTKTPEQGELGGAVDLPYAIPNTQVEYSYVPSHVPRGWWRSVEHTPNAYAVECFLDELAAAGKKDPFALRLKLLGEDRKVPLGNQGETLDTARLKRVLELAAKEAAWGEPLPPRNGRGVACHYSFGSYVAQVVEVAVDKDGAVKVNTVACVVDCGQVVNPNIVAAQMEGAIAFGLTAALKAAITIENGRVAQGNFNNYPILHINEMPSVGVKIVPSTEPPGGVGEPGVPPLAPALCNAIFQATGVRVRSLPIRTRALRQR